MTEPRRAEAERQRLYLARLQEEARIRAPRLAAEEAKRREEEERRKENDRQRQAQLARLLEEDRIRAPRLAEERASRKADVLHGPSGTKTSVSSGVFGTKISACSVAAMGVLPSIVPHRAIREGLPDALHGLATASEARAALDRVLGALRYSCSPGRPLLAQQMVESSSQSWKITPDHDCKRFMNSLDVVRYIYDRTRPTYDEWLSNYKMDPFLELVMKLQVKPLDDIDLLGHPSQGDDAKVDLIESRVHYNLETAEHEWGFIAFRIGKTEFGTRAYLRAIDPIERPPTKGQQQPPDLDAPARNKTVAPPAPY